MQKNIGGDGRIGSGKKMSVEMHGYGRSTHNLGRAWRSTIAPGVLTPCFVEYGLNGDNWDIDINSFVRTIPTLGPLYGSFKMQVDFYKCDLRLYNAQLHNNELNIGRNMNNIKFPMVQFNPKKLTNSYIGTDINSQQVSPSNIISYLGIRGFGNSNIEPEDTNFTVEKNAMPLIAYWDIYKNYYANKQEEIGYVLAPNIIENEIEGKIGVSNMVYSNSTNINREDDNVNYNILVRSGDNLSIWLNKDKMMITTGEVENSSMQIYLNIRYEGTQEYQLIDITSLFTEYNTSDETIGENSYIKVSSINAGADFRIGYRSQGEQMTSTGIKEVYSMIECYYSNYEGEYVKLNTESIAPAKMKKFDLANIDEMRTQILRHDYTTPLKISKYNGGVNIEPYKTVIEQTERNKTGQYKTVTQNTEYPLVGLGLKTYQSDRFNNWVNTEWIDGENGVNEITAIDTSGGSFTMDTLILQKKIYNMLNRIAMSGGTYDDWQEAVYGQYTSGKPESPVYVGGYSSEITFGEVTSTAESGNNPLGTLGGRGNESDEKGGRIKIKCDEACIIMGIVSLTPRIDYSQGNKWFNELETMNDLHKPALDGIGFQELLTEEFAAWDVMNLGDGSKIRNSVGKQTAYIEWQTAVNECYGKFATDELMYMTLNRRYTGEVDENGVTRVVDETTYIDPQKHNYAFADTDRDAENFWINLGIGATARRIMSAKEMPNL